MLPAPIWVVRQGAACPETRTPASGRGEACGRSVRPGPYVRGVKRFVALDIETIPDENPPEFGEEPPAPDEDILLFIRAAEQAAPNEVPK